MAGSEPRASPVFGHLLFVIMSPDYILLLPFHRRGNGRSKTLLTCSSLGEWGPRDSHSTLTPKPVFSPIGCEKLILIGVLEREKYLWVGYR